MTIIHPLNSKRLNHSNAAMVAHRDLNPLRGVGKMTAATRYLDLCVQPE